MTPPRRGLIRLVRVCCVLVAAGYGAWWVYDYAFKPGEVRRRVLEELTAKFDGVDVEVGSARMRPFLGGINITDLKLIRRDDPTRTPFLHVPKATIWFDKSLALQKLPLGKIELDDAHIHLVRDAEGKWNVQGLMHPAGKGDGPAPVLVLKKARVSIQDNKQGLSGELDIRDTDLTVVNDPVSLYTVEARGEADPFGKFHLSAKYEDKVGATGQLEINDAAIGESLGKLLGMAKPEAAQLIEGLEGRLGLTVKLDWKVGQPAARGLDVEATLTGATYRTPNLPSAITDLSAKLRFRDGDLKVEPVSGKFAGADFHVKLDMDFRDLMTTAAAPPDILGTLNERIRKLEVDVTDLQVGQDLFAMLPPKSQEIYDDYLPKGPADVTFEQRREGDRTLRKALFRPKGMSAMYKGFPYPVDHIRGSIDATLNPDDPTKLVFDLAGEGNGQTVTLKGTVLPEKENKDVNLRIVGSTVTLDKTLIAALPGTIPKFVDSLRATATGDFTVNIRHNARTRREHGPKVFDNEFDIFIRDGTLNYEEFPYPLKNLTGNLYIHTVPDHPTGVSPGPGMPAVASDSEVGSVAFKNFQATGPGGSKLKLGGSKTPEPGGSLLAIDASVESLALSGDLYKAVGKLGMDKVWNTFEPTGRMNCNVQVRVHDRCPGGAKDTCPFVPARDLELGLSFNGASVCPKFFAYSLSDLAGKIRYAQSRVEIQELRGRHGPVSVTLASGEVRLPASGGFWADLYDLKIAPVVADREFLTALPSGVRRAWEGLDFKGPVTLHAQRLVVDDQGKSAPPARSVPHLAGAAPGVARGVMAPAGSLPTFYWDATLTFQNASFNTGVTWEKATGQLGTRGLFQGDRLGRVVANVAVDQATVLKQPIEMVSAHLDIDPAAPDVILVPWLKGKIYGGEVAGQARIDIGTPLRFDLSLSGTRLRLDDMAKANHFGPKTNLSGLATARLNLSNPVDARTRMATLTGDGSIDVPNGRLLDPPGFVNVIKLARLRPMDETLFEEAHAAFRIRGNRVRFTQLDLLGNALSLGGDGEMNLDGTNAGFEFYTVWTNIREFLGGTGEIPARLSGNLYKIKVSGNLADEKPHVEQIPLPAVMEPIRRLLGRK